MESSNDNVALTATKTIADPKAAFDAMFKSDEQAEADGAWMDVPGVKGARLLLRSQWSNAWRAFSAKQQRRHAKLFRANKEVPIEDQDNDIIEQLARVGVLNWEGMQKPYSVENVRSLMTEYPIFRNVCMSWTADRSNFGTSVEDVEGN
jgi:hypothetical protein